MSNMGKLRFVDSYLTATMPGEKDGEVIEARFHVFANDTEKRKRLEFDLEAMTEQGYKAWFMEREIEGAVTEETPPLIIPDEYVAARGLVEVVTELYLDPAQPDRINAIEKNLHGPYGEDRPGQTD